MGPNGKKYIQWHGPAVGACDLCGKAEFPVAILRVGPRRVLLLCIFCLAHGIDQATGWTQERAVRQNWAMRETSRALRKKMKEAGL